MSCSQAGCKGDIKCGSGSCDVTCLGSACKQVYCGTDPCKVRYESSACQGTIHCGTGPCTVECAGSECKSVDYTPACSCQVTTTGSGGPKPPTGCKADTRRGLGSNP